jgi:E3 ubiquitin-protein ligase SHPRH
MDAQLGTSREQLEGEASKVVRGSWGTKVEAVARRVLWLLDDARPGADADARALVFSEWEDALRVVAAALRANGVDVEHPAGGGKKLRDAIERFKAAPALSASSASPPPRVLLMPLRRGANGLNLTEAQHVILLEPVLDPGAEAQAMKRVDRIGQTKPTCVHRFLLSGTVEENVHELSRRRREAAVGDGGGDVGRGRGGAGSGMKLSEVDVLVPPA